MSKLDKIKNAKMIVVYNVHSSLMVPYRSEKIFITTKSDKTPDALKTYFETSAHALQLIRGCKLEDKSHGDILICKLHYENEKTEKRWVEKTSYAGKHVKEYIDNVQDVDRIVIC